MPAGEEAQVGFDAGAPQTGPDGKRRRTRVIRIALSYSRNAQSESRPTSAVVRLVELSA
jgi:hypothetical protein